MADSHATKSTFDIVSRYRSLHSTSSHPPPLLAIESLIALLASPEAAPTTITETLTLIQSASATLLDSIPVSNPTRISVSAGTDLFQRYLIETLQRPPRGDFSMIREHLLSQSRDFITEALQANGKIASHALQFIRDSEDDDVRYCTTIVTYGKSDVVDTILSQAEKAGRYFRVVYFAPSSTSTTNNSQPPLNGLPISTLPISALAYALSTLSATVRHLIIFAPAAALLSNGGVLAQMGTYQLALLAKTFRVPFYVTTESYKFVKHFPLRQDDLPVEQEVVRWAAAGATEGKNGSVGDAEAGRPQAQPAAGKAVLNVEDDAVDYTPPDLITVLITERGLLSPAAVAEEAALLSD